ncbi:E3 ubiquitin-protein ligase ATL4 [Apostasia shenzhenica]|uniref:E3 ubiquitin-protein ligase ATL4 n=1 Tax=Apostasia shenzhenica TaxID=1088818 RepID=A0A2I0ACK7_9ASPA|nr:E3 ubiquitin-protein ligase ATL4 [Apostasia shenzhenica]
MLAVPSSPPPPPLPPPPPQFPNSSVISTTASGRDGHSGGLSLLIIVGIIAFVIFASASIHFLLRLLSRSPSASSSSSSPPSPIPLLSRLTASASTSSPASDRDQLISSLPLFTLASSVASLPKSPSLDCAVCLGALRPADELRLLPACRHAFHSQCVDTWLRSTPSCPLCRSSIRLPPLADDSAGAESFHLELGSVSSRRSAADGVPAVAAAHGRSYSLRSSFEYLVEEEVQAVLERLRREPEGAKEDKPENAAGDGEPAPPETEVAEAAAGGRGWLRDCVDRMISSASSSFNSLRFSGRIGSLLFDGSGRRSWDMEGNQFVEWEEQSGFAVFHRWLVGV